MLVIAVGVVEEKQPCRLCIKLWKLNTTKNTQTLSLTRHQKPTNFTNHSRTAAAAAVDRKQNQPHNLTAQGGQNWLNT